MSKRILGIDEAGRGALLGELVICGALTTDDKIQKLMEIKVKDSKELSPEKRAELAPQIKKILDAFEIVRISPKEIDTSRRAGTNLNELEVKKIASIINSLNPDAAYVDAVDSSIRTFKRRLSNHLKVDSKIIAEHYADKTYPIVSAASILAKIERDASIEELKTLYGEVGSGYPSDQITTNFLSEWLQTHKKLPKIVRETWSTVSQKIGKEKQKSLDVWLKNGNKS